MSEFDIYPDTGSTSYRYRQYENKTYLYQASTYGHGISGKLHCTYSTATWDLDGSEDFTSDLF